MITKWWKILNNSVQVMHSNTNSVDYSLFYLKDTQNRDIRPVVTFTSARYSYTSPMGCAMSIPLSNVSLNGCNFTRSHDPLKTYSSGDNGYSNFTGAGKNFLALGYSSENVKFDDYNLKDTVPEADYQFSQIDVTLDFDDDTGLCLLNIIIVMQWVANTPEKQISEIGLFKTVCDYISTSSNTPMDSITYKNIMIARDLLPEPFTPKKNGIYTFTYQIAM